MPSTFRRSRPMGRPLWHVYAALVCWCAIGVAACCAEMEPPPMPTPPAPTEAPSATARERAADELEMTREEILATIPTTLPPRARPLADDERLPRWTAGRALAWHDGLLAVVHPDEPALRVLDDHDGSLQRIIPLASPGAEVVVAPDGAIFATARAAGQVVRIAPDAVEVSAVVDVGPDPVGLALSKDASTLYVAVGGLGLLRALDAATLAEVAVIGGLQRPRDVAVSPGGDVLVAQLRAGPRLLAAPSHGGPGRLDRPVRPRTSLPFVATLRPGLGRLAGEATRFVSTAWMPGRDHALVLHDIVRSGDEEVGRGGGGGGYGTSGGPVAIPADVTRPVDTAVTVVDHLGGTVEEATPMVADPETGGSLLTSATIAVDVAMHPTWSLAFVSGLGSDTVLILNTRARDPLAAPIGRIADIPSPLAMAFDERGGRGWALSALDGALILVDLRPLAATLADGPPTAPAPEGERGGAPSTPSDVDRAQPVLLGPDRSLDLELPPLPATLARGRALFTRTTNPDVSADGNFACATCHFEGGEDGQVWVVAEGPRQTPALAGRLEGTAPFNWLGSEDGVIDNMHETIERMGGTGLHDEDADALAAFLLDGLAAPPNPHRLPGGLTATQARGEALFFDPVVGCSACHQPPTWTDGAAYDVGVSTAAELRQAQVQAVEAGEDPRHGAAALQYAIAQGGLAHRALFPQRPRQDPRGGLAHDHRDHGADRAPLRRRCRGADRLSEDSLSQADQGRSWGMGRTPGRSGRGCGAGAGGGGGGGGGGRSSRRSGASAGRRKTIRLWASLGAPKGSSSGPTAATRTEIAPSPTSNWNSGRSAGPS